MTHPSELDAEIQKTEARLAELQAQRAALGEPDLSREVSALIFQMAQRLKWDGWHYSTLKRDQGKELVAAALRRGMELAHLAWGTPAENVADMIQRRRQHANRKTHCIRGHEFTAENTMYRNGRQRRCRACHKAATGVYRKSQRVRDMENKARRERQILRRLTTDLLPVMQEMLWDALKQECCADPANATKCVMVGKEHLGAALAKLTPQPPRPNPVR